MTSIWCHGARVSCKDEEADAILAAMDKIWATRPKRRHGWPASKFQELVIERIEGVSGLVLQAHGGKRCGTHFVSRASAAKAQKQAAAKEPSKRVLFLCAMLASVAADVTDTAFFLIS